MGELILHIGTTKTGTSSLQRFLLYNRDLLSAHGIAIPIFTEQAGPTQYRNGCFVDRYSDAVARGKDPGARVGGLEENLMRLESSLASGSRALLTEETIPLSASRMLNDGLPPHCYWSTLANLLKEVGVEHASIVVYLRRQDAWAASWWRQSVKGDVTSEPLGRFCGNPVIRHAMDYAGMIAGIERAFKGRARIIVRRYDRAAFEGGDIYRDFCAACGIPWDETYRLPGEEANPSLTFDVAEALRAFPGMDQYQERLRRKVLIPLAEDLSRQNPDPPGMTPFDESQARSLMEPFLEGNALVSERYLDGAPLFSAEYGGRPVWAPDEERIAGYRHAFEEAIRAYPLRAQMEDRLRILGRRLSDGVKRRLKGSRRGAGRTAG